MKITLDLNPIQLTILHALVGQSADSAIAKIVRDESHSYALIDEDVFEVYKRTLAYIDNHPTYLPFGDELCDLYEKIDDVMIECGEAFKENRNEQ